MLASGTRLGSYEITGTLGAGGMGEVYRARDTRLKRDVALKILPDAFAADPERLARFEREAQVLASLNHPHIAAIYGIEESAGTRALVLELVGGETLADRIARGAIPLDEALPIARQIAEALEAAHEHGIIHRDLKPANIKITPDRVVKVLDFGLAKLTEAATADAAVHVALSNSPTITSPALMTGVGVLLGTAAYMSPEQAKGRPVDKRSDVWAFGCVLYEMLTGQRAFDGEDVSDTLASVLKQEPGWTGLPSDTPPAIRRLLRRALVKERRERLADITDARFEISEAITAPNLEATGVRGAPRRERLLGMSAALIVGVVAAAVAAWSLLRASPPPPKPIARFVVALSANDQFSATGRNVVAVSPDGSHIAYVANQRLYLRALDQLEATPIRGTEVGAGPGHGRNPFFSPDGQWIGFWQMGELKKVSINGGAPVTLCAAQNPFGASWGADDAIIFGEGSAGIWRVSGSGGTPDVLIKMDDGQLAHGPQLLPGGNALLFTLATSNTWDDAQIVVQSLGMNDRKVLVRGGRDGRYLPTGHLMYGRNGTLWGVPFDLQMREVTGAPVPLIEGISDAGAVAGDIHLGVSSDGLLVYSPGVGGPQRVVVWVDRQGREEPTNIPPGTYTYPRLSPDGRKLAVSVQGANADIWVYDLQRGTFTRLTFEGQNARSVWTPDGARITFGSDRAGGNSNIYWVPADGSGAPERLTTNTFQQVPEGWAPDGKTLVFSEFRQDSNWDIWTLSAVERKPQLFLRTPFHDGGRAFASDSRWLAYYSDESGRGEVYVRPFPGPGARFQVSTDGGAEPVWASNGREIFYRSGNRLMVVDVTLQPTFSAGPPRMLFQGPYETALPANFTVSRDGQRFLMIKAVGASRDAPRLILVQNWFEELKRRVPVN